MSSRALTSILCLAAAAFGADANNSEPGSGAAAQVLQLERQIGAAIVNGERSFL